MRILFVISCLSYGGAEKNLMLVASHLSKKNEVAICNFNERDTKRDIPLEITYYEQNRWDSSGKKFDWIGLRKAQYKFLKGSCKKFAPDVIISFLPMPNAIAVLCGKKLHIPVIISERADPYQSISKIDKLINYIYGFSDGAVFQTAEAKNYYKKKLQKKSTVIPNPVAVSETVEVHDPKSAKKEIACVGRFENKQKRQDLAIKAMKLIHGKYPDYKMVFWGDGDDLDSAKTLAYDLLLDDCVVFNGVSENVLYDIKDSEIYLLTSDYEGIPNTLIEAMSIGMPCVSTDCSPGGARLLLGDSENGIVVPCGDVDAIARAVVELIEDKELSASYGNKAKRSLDRFSVEKIMRDWDEYITKIANKNIG